MIAFGCSVTEEETYERHAEPGFRFAAEPDTEILTFGSVGSIFRSYNMLLEQAKARGGLEGFIIVHQDAEIVDPELIPKVRAALRGPRRRAGRVRRRGRRAQHRLVGGVGHPGLLHPALPGARGGEVPALSWAPEQIPAQPVTGEVDSIDGLLIAFSPWAIENLRFDESIGGRMHGYDFDICMQARAAGKKVVATDLGVIHHHQLDLMSEAEAWVETHVKLTKKWEEHLPEPTGDWRYRARRAEAQLAALRLESGASRMIWEMRAEQLGRELHALNRTSAWRATRPLRWLKSTLRSK